MVGATDEVSPLGQELQAKEVVAKGFVFQGTILLAEPFFPQQRATQCMKCAQFGHVAKHCRGQEVCARCAGDHRTDQCKSEKTRCSNCKKDHPAWSAACSFKQAAKEKARIFKTRILGVWRHTAQTQQEAGTTHVPVNPRKRKGGPNEDTTQGTDPRVSQVSKPVGRPKGIDKAGQAQANKINTMLLASQQAKEGSYREDTVEGQMEERGMDLEDSDMEDAFEYCSEQ